MPALSQVGRKTLIKAVARAMPLCCVSTFLLPRGWCEDINRMLKNFWWGFSAQKSHNFTPKAWSSICLPKEVGGIGIRKMYEVNLALVAKLGCQVLNNPEKLWVSIAKAKYRIESPLISPSSHGKFSVVWKGILKVVPLLKTGCCLWP